MNAHRGLVLSAAMVLAVVLFAIGARAPGGGVHPALAAQAPAPFAHQQPCEETSNAGEVLHHASIVIVFPDGTDSYCIPFEGKDLSGAELLERTGLPLVLSGFGGLGVGVCRIDDVGCSDPGDCFCQCRGGECSYWSSFEFTGGKWHYLQVGASQHRVSDGDIVGWVWGNGRSAPGVMSMAVCASVHPTPVPTPTPVPQPLSEQPLATSAHSALPASTPLPDAALAATRTSVQTPTGPVATIAPSTSVAPGAFVVRQSTRPTPEPERAGSLTSSDSEGSGAPIGLLAFAGIAGGLVLVGGGIALRRTRSG